MTEKRCTKCGEVCSLDEFGRDTGKRDGHQTACKACTAARKAAHYAANADEIGARGVIYRATNPEVIKARNAAYYAANADKEKARAAVRRAANLDAARAREAAYNLAHRVERRAGAAAWRAAHPEQARASDAAWVKANPDKVRAMKTAWRVAHSQQVRAIDAARRNAHPERGRSAGQRRRARLRGGIVENFTDLSIFDRDDWLCGICGEPIDPALRYPAGLSVSLDHIVPTSLGGWHVRQNVQTAHLICNQRKGARTEGVA